MEKSETSLTFLCKNNSEGENTYFIITSKGYNLGELKIN